MLVASFVAVWYSSTLSVKEERAEKVLHVGNVLYDRPDKGYREQITEI